MKDLLSLIRWKHWLKNALVFIPIFFHLTIFDVQYFKYCLLAFLTFSCASSVVYVINDIFDVEVDRKHPVKKNRPLAAGTISISQAKMVVVVLAILTILWMGLLYLFTRNGFIILIPIFYIILNIFYSKYLKKIPIIDVAIIVLGFVLRVVYGALATSVLVSKYLYLMIVFGGFYLGFCKRRNELMRVGAQSRGVLNDYSVVFLDKNMYVSYTLAIVVYTLWSVDETVTVCGENDYRFWTIPLVMLIFQLYSLNVEKNSHGDPVDVILSDKILLAAIGLYVAVMLMILYVI